MPEYVFLEVVRIGAAVLVVGMVVWGIVSFAKSRTSRTLATGVGPSALKSIEERLARLEESNESISLQIERVGEGQRFVTKLLSDAEKTTARLKAPQG
jgi:chromosome segregation and condensation protein ScpB